MEVYLQHNQQISIIIRLFVQKLQEQGVSERVPEYKIIVDETTYNSLDPSVRSAQNVYDYEVEQNDNKRNIQFINPDFIQDIDYEVKENCTS